MKNLRLSTWLRIPILIVFFLNVQCAAAFIFSPEKYVSSFEMSGLTGKWMIHALGILFLMWNVPYFFALLDPVKNLTSLKEAVFMQVIGGSGETLLYLSMDKAHSVIRSSIERFMWFDWAGVVLLMIALGIVFSMSKAAHQPRING